MIDVEAHENIIIEVRKHWWALFEELAIVAFIFFIPIFFYAVLTSFPILERIPGEPAFLFFAFFATWTLAMWITGFMIWTEYFLDIWLVTDQKLVSVDQSGIFSRQISTVQLNKVQDVTVEVRGLVATFLKYGDVKIQTAGEEREFVIHKVARPSDVEMVINRAIEQYDREH